MEGDEQRRFCSGCGCFVNNLSEMTADESETLLSGSGRKCVRATVDAKHGILTKDGWIPRLLLAGAIATMAVGCETNTGEVSCPTNEPVQESPEEVTKAKARVVSSNPDDEIVGSVILGGMMANTALAQEMRSIQKKKEKVMIVTGDVTANELIKKSEKKR